MLDLKVFTHRLLLLAEAFPPSRGGIQAYLAGLWAALPPTQSLVVAAAQPGDGQWDLRQHYRIVRVHTESWSYPRWRQAWEAARHIVEREKIEAVVCGKALFEGRAALRLKREFGTPYVVCAYATEIFTWLKSWKTRRDLRDVLWNASRVIVVNEDIKQKLLRLGVPSWRVIKIYPGVDDDAYVRPEGIEEFRKGHHLEGKDVVVSVARLIPRKGLDVLIGAFSILRATVPNAHLLVVGDGPEYQRLIAASRRAGVESSVTFLGALPRADVLRALACATVFALTPRALPGDEEGFGIAYMEAAAMGLPAVASRVGGVPEAVRDGETGLLVPPGDPRATADVLVRLLRDSALRQELAKRARTRTEKEFHWKGRAFLFQGMIHAMLTDPLP